jgi:cellulose synthase/poly-beta-1,6-N-acetylglucosamine synthase-like glycosyltransferase
VVRKVGPWSVFKLSLIFYFVVMLIGWGALLIVYGILGASGAIKSITDLSSQIGLWDNAKAQPTIDGQQLFTWLFVAGLVAVVIWSLINVLVALAYNLVSDVVGGLELTLAESKHRDDV